MDAILADSRRQSSGSSWTMQRASIQRYGIPSRRTNETASWNVFGNRSKSMFFWNSAILACVVFRGSDDPQQWLRHTYISQKLSEQSLIFGLLTKFQRSSPVEPLQEQTRNCDVSPGSLEREPEPTLELPHSRYLRKYWSFH